jgi:hypothetical protein
MMTFFLILGAGLFGVAGHWLTRFAQERTQSTFVEYLMIYKARTLSSVFSIIGSSSVIFQTAPVDVSGRDLIMLLIGAYSAGYMLDSTVNKDKAPEPVVIRGVNKSIKEFEEDDKANSLNAILSDDSDL